MYVLAKSNFFESHQIATIWINHFQRWRRRVKLCMKTQSKDPFTDGDAVPWWNILPV
jgi:hypothetical protein